MAAFEEAIHLDCNNAEYYPESAQLYEEQGRTRQAIGQWKQTKALQPRLEFSLARGNVYLAIERYSDAIQEYQELLENDPDMHYVRPKLAAACRLSDGVHKRRSLGLKTVTRDPCSATGNRARHLDSSVGIRA